MTKTSQIVHGVVISVGRVFDRLELDSGGLVEHVEVFIQGLAARHLHGIVDVGAVGQTVAGR